MISWICSFLKREEGAVLPTLAIAAPVILGMTALGADGSYYVMTKSNLQTAVDAAAYAAAWEVSQGSESNMQFMAELEAERNGFDSSIGNLTLEKVTRSDGQIAIDASISQPAPLWFFNAVVSEPFNIRVDSSSLVSNDYIGNYCILALDETASGAFKTVGNVTINASSCGLAVNSSSESAIDLSGSIDLNFGTVTIAGDYDINGGAAEFNYSNLHSHSSRVRDPYADLKVPTTTPCTSAAVKKGTKITGSGTATLNPGVYCGDVTVTGNNTLVLNPGIYVIDGGNFNIQGGGTLTGNGVTIIMTNTGAGVWGKLSISGNRVVRLSAPTTGYYAGVTVFVDRRAPDNGTTHSITGTADILINGVIYIPTQNLTFGGTATSLANNFHGCTKLIGQIIWLHGTPVLGTECTGSSVRQIGNRIVKLTG